MPFLNLQPSRGKMASYSVSHLHHPGICPRALCPPAIAAVAACANLGRNGQNSESKKEEFRKYLERAGVIDALTKGTPPAPSHPPATRRLPPRTPIYHAAGARHGIPRRAAAAAVLTSHCAAVLVALYETAEKPANALECAPPPTPHPCTWQWRACPQTCTVRHAPCAMRL